MINKIFIFLLLFSFQFSKSQVVRIEGTALNTFKVNGFVGIDVNDTLRKFRKKAFDSKNWDGYQELCKNKKYVTHSDSTGHFIITARLTDSIFFSVHRHITQKYLVSDLLKMKSIKIQLEREPCVEYVSCEQIEPTNYYIFIGKKIDVTGEIQPYYCNDIELFDAKFKSIYKIEKNIYGNFPKNIITFTALDHFGKPNFSKYDNVLLFVGEYCGKLYHEKYQYFDLYKTKNGKWACPGSPYKYNKYQKDKVIKPKKIKFDKSVWFDVSNLNPKLIEQEYPKEFYKIIDNKAVPFMGTYVEELITVKGYNLKAKINTK
ncbi:hypothetical protein [Flavobacterium pedocola]